MLHHRRLLHRIHFYGKSFPIYPKLYGVNALFCRSRQVYEVFENFRGFFLYKMTILVIGASLLCTGNDALLKAIQFFSVRLCLHGHKEKKKEGKEKWFHICRTQKHSGMHKLEC